MNDEFLININYGGEKNSINEEHMNEDLILKKGLFT